MDFVHQSSRLLVYATLRAENDAAVHLLELTRATAPVSSYMSQCLVSTSSFIGYQLRLGPKEGHGAWRIGTGHRGPLSATRHSGVDFLLGPPSSSLSASRARKSIDGLHGLFYLHPDSGLIMFRSLSDKQTYYHQRSSGETIFVTKPGRGGGSDGVGERQQTCVMRNRYNRLQIGSYEFSLVYEVPTNDRLLTAARELRDLQVGMAGGQPSKRLPMYPPLQSKLLGHVAIFESATYNRDMTVHVGIDVLSGKPLQVTELAFEKSTERRFQAELKYRGAFAGDVSDGVVGIIDSWCEHGQSPPCGPTQIGQDPDFTERIYYSRPLITSTWSALRWDDIRSGPKLRFLEQALLGLRNIHHQGLVHGRINPDNLIILPDERTDASWRIHEDPSSVTSCTSCRSFRMRAAIDQPTCLEIWPKRRARPLHTILGTQPPPSLPFVRWSPPENWEPSLGPPHSAKGDIFSLGLCFLNAYSDICKTGRLDKVDGWGHAQVTYELEHLKPILPKHLYALMKDMLHWTPALRPTAAEALSHIAWRDQKWIYMGHAELERGFESLERVKRVRFAEPEPEPEREGGQSESEEGQSEPEEGRPRPEEEGRPRPEEEDRPGPEEKDQSEPKGELPRSLPAPWGLPAPGDPQSFDTVSDDLF